LGPKLFSPVVQPGPINLHQKNHFGLLFLTTSQNIFLKPVPAGSSVGPAQNIQRDRLCPGYKCQQLIKLHFNTSIWSSTFRVHEHNNTKYLCLISCWIAWNVKMLTKHTLWDRSRLECSHWVEAHILRGRLLLKVRSRRTADSASDTIIRFLAFIASIETQFSREASWCNCEITTWSFFWKFTIMNVQKIVFTVTENHFFPVTANYLHFQTKYHD
jgi:hypothetical protein